MIPFALLLSPFAFAFVQGTMPATSSGGAWPALPLALTDFETKVAIALFVIIPAIALVVAGWKKLTGQSEPETRNHVTGGPLTVREEIRHVERREHETFRESMEKQQSELWEVINGMRRSIGRIETDFAGLRATREANGDRISELSNDVKGLSSLVHELVGVIKSKGGRS